MNRFLSFRQRSLLITALGSLALPITACAGANYVSTTPADTTRPANPMTQTDFVIRVVNYSCLVPGCNDVGQRNANMGSSGIRETIRDMCWTHTLSNTRQAYENTMTCFDRATMSVNDPGLSQLLNECKAANTHAVFQAECYASALWHLRHEGKDLPITALIPRVLAAPGVASAGEPTAGGGQPGGVRGFDAPSCAEYVKAVGECNAEMVPQLAAAIRTLSEAECAATLSELRSLLKDCKNTKAARSERLFLSALGIDGRLNNGLLVTGVVRESAPHRAGLRAGDLITGVNGGPASLKDWVNAHLTAGLGGSIKVNVKHNKASETLEWTIAKCDHPECECMPSKICTRSGDTMPRQVVGLELTENRVTGVPDGPAGRAGIQVGDEVVALNGIPIRDTNSLVEIIGQLGMGDPVKLTYSREGKQSDVEVRLAAPIP